MTGRLRIVHCFRSPVGGIFRHVRDLTDAQVAQGHAVGIVCDSTTGGAFEERLFEDIRPRLALGVHRTPMQRHIGPGDAASAWRTYRIIKELKPDVLHGHGAKGGTYARLFGSLLPDLYLKNLTQKRQLAIRRALPDAFDLLVICAEAGLAKPDISLIDDDFVDRVKNSDRPNLQIELLKRLLADGISQVGRRNLVTGREFSELLSATLLRYQNRTLDAAQVIAELVALARHLKAEADRGSSLGLSSDELAFYDAIRTNASAVTELGDDTLRQIAHELVEIVRRDAKTDWNVKEQVRAKLRATIKRLLLRHGYPPDQEPGATQLVLAQAELIAGDQPTQPL